MQFGCSYANDFRVFWYSNHAYYSDHAPPHFHAKYGDDEGCCVTPKASEMATSQIEELDPVDNARAGVMQQPCDDEALIQISPLGVLKGKLPPRALSLVIEWAQVHQKELMEDWDHAASNKKLQKIPPLQ